MPLLHAFRLALFGLAVAALVPAAHAQTAPERVVARSGETEVVLHWEPVDGADGYAVLRRETGGTFQQIATSSDNHYVDRSGTSATPYAYAVRTIAGGIQGPASENVDAATGPLDDDAFLDLVQALAFDYFWYEANPETGLVKDRSTGGSASSTAAVGFGLTALGIGVERGWATRQEAAERTLAALNTLWTTPQGPQASGTSGYKGFFYHFLDMETGLRDGTNELSTIDTALLMAGVLYAREYFDGAGADETEIRTLAQNLYDRVDWRWSQAGGSGIRLGWFPESGFIQIPWIGYNEAMLLYLMAFGSETFPAVPDWDFWTNPYEPIAAYGQVFVRFPPLFGHQYSHAWVDFRGIQDDYMRGFADGQLDYFENSRRATLAQQSYAIDNPQNHPNYGADEWGFTASDDPIDGYAVHGAVPAVNDNGTITPTAAGGSIAFTPEESTEALRAMYARYPNSLWNRYGFKDAYNLRRVWFASDFLGIDQGPFVLMIENLRTEHVWDVMRDVPEFQRGLDRAGFEPTIVSAEPGADGDALGLAVAPNPSASSADIRFTLDAPAAVRVTVSDALGREVAVLLDGQAAAGPQAVRWDAPAAAGVYVVRVEAGGTVATARLTRLPR